MGELNINAATRTDLTSAVSDYSVDPITTDAAAEQKETYWDNSKGTQWLGYYKTIPELKKAIDALAMWTAGKGYTANAIDTPVLDKMTGWGEDTFESICNNLLICKKVYGDAFAEIIRNPDTGTLINLKVLDPSAVRIVANRKGRIKRYELRTKTGAKNQPVKKFEPHEILHLCNNRVADEIHGVSEIEAVEWVILARNEAMSDWKKVLHRNIVPVRVIEVDEDDSSKLATLKTQYQEAIDKGEVLILPKGAMEMKETSPILQDPLAWIRYLENFFYQALGIPKVVLGGSEEFTEASAKIGYLTFEQVYSKEQRELEADLWNQIAIKVTFNKPVSLKNEMLTTEDKNPNEQTGFQPNDVQAGVGS